jgi:hypothetical protein
VIVRDDFDRLRALANRWHAKAEEYTVVDRGDERWLAYTACAEELDEAILAMLGPEDLASLDQVSKTVDKL